MTPLQAAFPDVDIIEGVTEFQVIGDYSAFCNGHVITLRKDDASNAPFFWNKNKSFHYPVRITQIKLKENPMNKTVKVENGQFQIPEGHEIDTVTFKKKVNNLPESWGEFCSCNPLSWQDANFLQADFVSDEYRALKKLQLMRDVWVGDWVPHFNNLCQKKIVIFFDGDEVRLFPINKKRHVLMFPSNLMAQGFLKAHKELIETAKPLL